MENIEIRTNADGSLRITIPDMSENLGDTKTEKEIVAKTSYFESIPGLKGYTLSMVILRNPKKAETAAPEKANGKASAAKNTKPAAKKPVAKPVVKPVAKKTTRSRPQVSDDE